MMIASWFHVFETVGLQIVESHCNHVLYCHHHALVALALYLCEHPLEAIEWPAVDSHACALCEVDRPGLEEEQLAVVSVCHLDEVIHLLVRHHDWHTFSLAHGGHVLQEWHLGLESLEDRLFTPDEEQIVNHWFHEFHPPAAQLLDHIMHGDESLDPAGIKQVLRLEFAPECRPHGVPLLLLFGLIDYRVVAEVCDLWVGSCHNFASAHSFGVLGATQRVDSQLIT